MNKRIVIIVSGTLAILLLFGFIMLNKQLGGQESITGIVIDISEGGLFVENEEGQYYVDINDKTRIFSAKEIIDKNQIKKGQKIEIIYEGGIAETDPGEIIDVKKILII